MLDLIRKKITNALWQEFTARSKDCQLLLRHFQSNYNIYKCPLDHFAIIDLPGPHSGLPILLELFTALGYVPQGSGYLASKQNDFMWLASPECHNQTAVSALPQIVIADFRLHLMPNEIQNIIEKYARYTSPICMQQIKISLSKKTTMPDEILKKILNYLTRRDWPLPSLEEFLIVKNFNELLAWVLIFGKQVNHFTLSLHLLGIYSSLNQFHDEIKHLTPLSKNVAEEIIKGNSTAGIEQSSTQSSIKTITLSDSIISVASDFIEFIWRFPKPGILQPTLWKDYHTGFIADHADTVIESLYSKNKK